MWSASFDFANEVLKTIPLWIQLPKLPLSCWEDDSLSRIGSTLGIPIYADACTTRVERISYARILVEMDVTKPLPKQIKVEDPNRREFEQEVWYDWLPQYCTKCLQLGHICQEQQKEEVKQKGRELKPKQFWRKKEQGTKKQDIVAEVNNKREEGKNIEGVQSKEIIKSQEQNEEEGWQIVKEKSIVRFGKHGGNSMGAIMNGGSTPEPTSSLMIGMGTSSSNRWEVMKEYEAPFIPR
ncbi:PREDICTED: uncharacterized protein LOC109216895 [Nicotiana attenuata]|uniref:uncharacterized protein LOC109216895 n=1 Tax=Nicotiana attenuata TaxID=49451 RepID=UPI00090486EA|nr:PREDICTED: uncharacterized protein LOC109216895 [Nicotiana attenuata]